MASQKANNVSNSAIVRFKEIRLTTLYKKEKILVFRETLNPVDHSELNVVLVSTKKNKELVKETSEFRLFTENELQTEQNKSMQSIESRINQSPQTSSYKIDKAIIPRNENHHSLLLVKEASTRVTDIDKFNNPNKSQMVSTGTNTATNDCLANTISSRKILRESSVPDDDDDIIVADDDDIIVSSENESDSLTKPQTKIKSYLNNFITPLPGK